jgi:hypothetical protein
MSASDLKDVTKRHPCPACGGDHRCRRGADVLHCWRPDEATVPDGWRRLPGKPGDASATFKPTADAPTPQRATRADEPSAVDVAATCGRWAAALTGKLRDELSDELNVPAVAVDAVPGIGWASADELRTAHAGGFGGTRPSRGAWSVPEVDATGRVVGVSLRVPGTGGKGSVRGSSRGLTVPTTLAAADAGAVVLVVEGASDVLATTAAGLVAVGRPSNTGGVDLLAELLADRSHRVIVVGENDRKSDGVWPGRDGAKAVATKLAEAWKRPARWAMVPAEAKDVRAWLTAHATDADPHAWHDAGRRLLASLDASAEHVLQEKPAAADRLAALLSRHFRIGRRDDDGEAFAVWRDHARPNVAMPLRGRGLSATSALAKLFRDNTGRTCNAAAIADVLAAAEGDAAEADAEPTGLRVAALDAGGIAVDLGTTDGRCVVVDAGGWELAKRSPVLFRRSPMIGPMPTPTRQPGVGLATLRELLNVRPDDWPPLVGWMVATLMPSLPCPILLMTGMQGTGKSSAARLVRGVCDPSPVPLAGEPRDAEAWAMHASAARVVAVDNVSRIPPWWSEALCRTVTGDGLVRRALYTNADAAVLKVKRPVVLTSIDAGAMRGDLAERLVTCELEPVAATYRRSEAELHRLADAAMPGVLADLLDALSAVLKATSAGVRPPAGRTGRMADFCGVLAALDHARPDLTGGVALELYHGQRERVADDVVASDPLASAVKLFVASHVQWSGTAGELLDALNRSHGHGPHGDVRPPRGWPADATRCGGQLKRLVPSLNAAGVRVTMPPRGKGGQVYDLLDTATADEDETARTAASPASPEPSQRHHASGRRGSPAATYDAGDAAMRQPASDVSTASLLPGATGGRGYWTD